MAFDYARLVEITTIPNTVGALYTHPVSTKAYVRLISIHNGNTVSETVKLYKVPNSGGSVGTPGITNCFFEESIPAYGTRILEYAPPGLMLLDLNETIQAVTNTASVVTIEINGGLE